jgi:hypothetical protein
VPRLDTHAPNATPCAESPREGDRSDSVPALADAEPEPNPVGAADGDACVNSACAADGRACISGSSAPVGSSRDGSDDGDGKEDLGANGSRSYTSSRSPSAAQGSESSGSRNPIGESPGNK